MDATAGPAAKARRRRRETERAMERANTMSNEAFVEQILRPSPDSGWPEWTHPRTGRRYELRVRRAGELSGAQMDACFRLVEATSGADYRASAGGWHPTAKRSEMASPELRYVLVVPLSAEGDGVEGDGGEGDDDDDAMAAGRVAGFTSMMATFEGDDPVVYCYEIHLEPALQGAGLGKQLLELLGRAAAGVDGVAKTMLTCFVANARARRFYRALGYAVDASSPPARPLRRGRAVAPDYVILSRPV